jgi:APA family basic amino acid/polyamine antiporter
VAEQLAYARKASGLVRGLSFWDAFGVGFMNQGLTPSIIVILNLGLGTYLGGNLWLVSIISLVLAGIGFPLVYGILSGSMPRAGGEYVYNSRILHPIVAFAESFGNAFVMIFWVYVLAPWIADPGLAMLAQYMGWDGLANFASYTNTWGVFAIASIFNVLALLTMVFGVKLFTKIQKVVMVIGMGGVAVICFALSFTSQESFAENWNMLAEKYDSIRYEDFVPAVSTALGSQVPTTWNWVDTFGVMVAGSWLFAYAYFCIFVAGEVKRPDKTLIGANFAAILVPTIFLLWVAQGVYRAMPFDFISAMGAADLAQGNYDPWSFVQGANGGPGYNFPFAAHWVTMGYVAWPSWVTAWAGSLSYIAFDFWYLALSYLAFPRIIFAWGMDRMGPKWFTDVSPRWASPVKNFILCFVLCELAIFLYAAWLGQEMQGLSVTGMEIVSVWGVTAIAALLFPWSRKAKGIWESSPYRKWRFLGLPVLTWGALVNIVYLVILFWFLIVRPEMRDWSTTSLYIYITVWALGIIWYFVYRWKNRSSGVDLSVTFGELPPE